MGLIIENSPLTPAITATTTTAFGALHVIIDPLKKILTPKESSMIIDVSTNREAEIAVIVAELMVAHPETIPPDLTIAIMNALTQEEADTMNLVAIANGVVKILDDHLKIVQNNRMVWANKSLDNGRHEGKSNSEIESVVKSISSRFFNRSASITESTYNISISGNIILKGVKTGKYLTNHHTSILKVLNVGGILTDTLTINPGNAVVIPKGWTNVVVTNMSGTEEGIFSVFMS